MCVEVFEVKRGILENQIKFGEGVLENQMNLVRSGKLIGKNHGNYVKWFCNENFYFLDKNW